MGLLGKFRQSPLFQMKRKRTGGQVATEQTFETCDEDLSTMSTADAFDRLYAERNEKGLRPLRQIVEEESNMRDSDDTSLLSQKDSPKKSRFNTFDNKGHVVTSEADADASPEYEPPQWSLWYEQNVVEDCEEESQPLLNREIATLPLSKEKETNQVSPMASDTQDRRFGMSQHHVRDSSGELGHIFVDDLPTLYEDETGSVQSTSSMSDVEETDTTLVLGESDIRARWDFALEYMSRMGQCADDTTTLKVFSSVATFSKPPLSPSKPMLMRKVKMEVAEI